MVPRRKVLSLPPKHSQDGWIGYNSRQKVPVTIGTEKLTSCTMKHDFEEHLSRKRVIIQMLQNVTLM